VVQNGQTVIDNKEIPGITGGALDSHEGLPRPDISARQRKRPRPVSQHCHHSSGKVTPSERSGIQLTPLFTRTSFASRKSDGEPSIFFLRRMAAVGFVRRRRFAAHATSI